SPSELRQSHWAARRRTNQLVYASSGMRDRDRVSSTPKSHHTAPSTPSCVSHRDDSWQTTRSHPSNRPFRRPERSGPLSRASIDANLAENLRDRLSALSH